MVIEMLFNNKIQKKKKTKFTFLKKIVYLCTSLKEIYE